MDNLAITVQILQILLVVYVCWYFMTVRYYVKRKSIGILGEHTVYYSKSSEWFEKPDAIDAIELVALIVIASRYDTDKDAIYDVSNHQDFRSYVEFSITYPFNLKIIRNNEKENL